jgi:hypothetical protein
MKMNLKRNLKMPKELKLQIKESTLKSTDPVQAELIGREFRAALREEEEKRKRKQEVRKQRAEKKEAGKESKMSLWNPKQE